MAPQIDPGALSEASKKQAKARNRKFIGPKNAPRAPASKKEGARGVTTAPEED